MISLILISLGLLLLLPTAYAGLIGAPYAPTRQAAIMKAFDRLKLGENDTLIDLGAGDGKVLRLAAARGAAATGYELSPIMWAVAWLRTWRLPRVRVKLRNFFREKLPTDTTVIFVFLMPEAMPRLRTYLLKQNILPTTRIATYTFPFPGLQPRGLVQTPQAGTVYIYTLADLQPDA